MNLRIRNSIVQYLILTQLAAPFAFANSGQRKPAASDPAYTSEEVAQKLDLLTVKGEAKGYSFANDKGERGTLKSITQNGGEIRIGVPASDGIGEFGYAIRGTAGDKGSLKIAVAAYDSKFQKRLTARSIEISGDPAESKLKLEQTVKSIQEEIRPKLATNTQNLYDLMVPSAQANDLNPMFPLHAGLAAYFWYLHSQEKRNSLWILPAVMWTAWAYMDLVTAD